MHTASFVLTQPQPHRFWISAASSSDKDRFSRIFPRRAGSLCQSVVPVKRRRVPVRHPTQLAPLPNTSWIRTRGFSCRSFVLDVRRRTGGKIRRASHRGEIKRRVALFLLTVGLVASLTSACEDRPSPTDPADTTDPSVGSRPGHLSAPHHRRTAPAGPGSVGGLGGDPRRGRSPGSER